jgi:hypothetical protein
LTIASYTDPVAKDRAPDFILAAHRKAFPTETPSGQPKE